MSHNWKSWHEGKAFYSAYDLPNGWTALVVDDSQICAPPQPTKYRISSSSRRLHIPWDRAFNSLQDARAEALSATLKLPAAPRSDDEAVTVFNEFSPYARKADQR